MPKIAAVILAAGKGTRMHSATPKVLHTLLGETMLSCVLHALRPVFGEDVWIVIGHKAECVRAAVPDGRFVLQEQQLGTGHALMAAMPSLKEAGCTHVLVVNGDVPLLTEAAVRKFMAAAAAADVAFATITLDDAGAYGRVVRREGKVQAIVEAKESANASSGSEPVEVNAGLYMCRLSVVEELLRHVNNANKSGEYYITDVIGLAVSQGLSVHGVCCGQDLALLGVNSPAELAQMEERLRLRIVEALLQQGVLLHRPHWVCVGPLANVEAGAEITGPCEIYGHTLLESGCRVESHCVLKNCHIEAGAEIRSFSHLEEAHVGPGALVGPYARLRPGAVLEAQSHVGNFVELKNTRLGSGAKANHLTYLGDAFIGEGTNIGAGTITCNYDGVRKHPTTIGSGAFIGSNTALVAPVRVGNNALVGAGSVITREVPDDTLGISRARQNNLPRKFR